MTITRHTRFECCHTVVTNSLWLRLPLRWFRFLPRNFPNSSRRNRPIPREERKNSSEESNETSEESSDKSEEFRHFLGRKSKISPEIFENSSGEIEMSLLSLHYNASALRRSALWYIRKLLYLCGGFVLRVLRSSSRVSESSRLKRESGATPEQSRCCNPRKAGIITTASCLIGVGRDVCMR